MNQTAPSRLTLAMTWTVVAITTVLRSASSFQSTSARALCDARHAASAAANGARIGFDTRMEPPGSQRQYGAEVSKARRVAR